MTGLVADRRGQRGKAAAPRVGLFGLLGSGNSGNDASLETVLAYLRDAHAEAVVDAMCGGPERVRAQYGIDTVPMFWYQSSRSRNPVLRRAFSRLSARASTRSARRPGCADTMR